MSSSAPGPTDWGAFWVRECYGVRPDDAADVLSAISRLAVLSASTSYVWRGVEDARFSVQPSVFRVPEFEGVADVTEASVVGYERSLLAKARAWGVGHGAETFPTYLSALATIQHHAGNNPAIGTRLLDVSTEPLTALWFASKSVKSPGHREPDGVVFAFRWGRLPTFGTHSDQRGTSDPVSGLDGGMDPLFVTAQGGPFVVRPDFPSSRMVAQNSLFLASRVPESQRRRGLREIGIDGLDLGTKSSVKPLTQGHHDYLSGRTQQSQGKPQQPTLVAIVVPGDSKERLREALATTYGRSEQTIYPDVQGFVDSWESRA